MWAIVVTHMRCVTPGHDSLLLSTEGRQDSLEENPDLAASVGHRGDPYVRQLGNLHLPHQHTQLHEGSAQVRHQKRRFGFWTLERKRRKNVQ